MTFPTLPPDRPAALRDVDAVPRPAIEAYLRHVLPDLAKDAVARLAQFPGGYSNLTFAVDVGGRELVLRRPPIGANVRGGHDMVREYRVLRALAEAGIAAPRPIALCNDASILGAPFYLMERVTGAVLRGPERATHLPPASLRRLGERLIDTLADLRAVDVVAAGLSDLGRPEGYIARQVAGWAQRYAAAQTDALTDMDRVGAWLAAHLPAEGPPALLHNDFKHDNIVVDPADPTRILAILDWEMATLGDPRMDLGTTLAYWSEAGDAQALRDFNVTALPGNLTRAEVVARYEQRTGRAIGELLFFYAFGLYKVGVIVQQLYARYRRGVTRDPRFAGLLDLERAMAAMASAALERGRI